MQLLLHLVMVGSGGHPCSKHAFRLDDQLFFPVLDLIRMNVKLLGQFGQGVLPSENSQGHFRLERRRVIPSCALCHLLLLSLKENIPQKISLSIQGFLSNEWGPLPFFYLHQLGFILLQEENLEKKRAAALLSQLSFIELLGPDGIYIERTWDFGIYTHRKRMAKLHQIHSPLNTLSPYQIGKKDHFLNLD